MPLMWVKLKLFKRKLLLKLCLVEQNKQCCQNNKIQPVLGLDLILCFFMDKIDNIRLEFLLLESNLLSYSFESMDSILPS